MTYVDTGAIIGLYFPQVSYIFSHFPLQTSFSSEILDLISFFFNKVLFLMSFIGTCSLQISKEN